MSSSHITASLAQGALVAGKYRLQRLLGEGAMGVVWSARNELTSGQVALKLIVAPGAELRLRLLREAQACCQIRHKNVIQIHDVGQMEGGDPFLVMELLAGETLADLLARKRRLNQREAAVIGRDVARALSAAHDQGIVHRDLKPANIFLHNQPGEDARVVKVLDFGVSKNLLAADGLQTMMGGAIGSPSYMSPEQARGARDIDARADIWSLGVLLFEMLTGERPFLGEAREVIESIQEGEIPLVSRRVRGLDPGLERLISGCLTRDREQRMWPIADVASGLEPFTEGSLRSTIPTLTAVWGAAPSPSAPPSSRPREPAALSAQEAESDAETQKLEPGTLSLFAAPRPVVRAEISASLAYDPTVRVFSASPLPLVPLETRAARANGTQAPVLSIAGEAAAPAQRTILPPALPAPVPLPLLPREPSSTPSLANSQSPRRGDLLILRAFVGSMLAAAVLFVAFTRRAPQRVTVRPETAAAVVEASPPVDRAASAPGVEAVAITAPPSAPDARVIAASTAAAPRPEIAPRPRPRAAAPRPLPPCGRFVKTGCDASIPKP